jgi:hypothetical protein
VLLAAAYLLFNGAERRFFVFILHRVAALEEMEDVSGVEDLGWSLRR